MNSEELLIVDETSDGAATLAGAVVGACLALLGKAVEWTQGNLRILCAASRIEIHQAGELVAVFDLGFGLPNPVLIPKKANVPGGWLLTRCRDATFTLVQLNAAAWVYEVLTAADAVKMPDSSVHHHLPPLRLQ